MFWLWLYVAAFLVWLTFRVVWFDAHWFLALLDDNALFGFAPLPFLLAYALWQREYALTLALLIPCLAFIKMYGARFWPRRQARRPRAAFRVTSFNMHYQNWDHDAFVRALETAQPDLVGLQEVSAANRALIETRLAKQFPYRIYQPIVETHAVALLSRYPLDEIEFLTPTVERGLRATAHLPDGALTVLVVHLAPPNMLTYPLAEFTTLARARFETRRAETAMLRALGVATPAPAVLLGDCNLSDTSKTYQTLASTWRDSFRERGWGLGLTLKIFLPFPLLRYDYIWHNAALGAADFHIGADGGSDHLPVSAALYFA
ncbi:hypothetical protein FBQ82_14015 [Anaerolineae bacterium CFX7]|nr:hypothetical protein [Anaerolineae bacterium CFX7]